MFRVVGMEKLLLEVHEGASNLDEALKEKVILIPGAQPEVLENVVRLVVLLGVKTGKIALVARIERQGGIRAELLDEGRDTGIFFHRAGGAAELFCPALCLTSV
jgi:hypothetical protein